MQTKKISLLKSFKNFLNDIRIRKFLKKKVKTLDNPREDVVKLKNFHEKNSTLFFAPKSYFFIIWHFYYRLLPRAQIVDITALQELLKKSNLIKKKAWLNQNVSLSALGWNKSVSFYKYWWTPIFSFFPFYNYYNILKHHKYNIYLRTFKVLHNFSKLKIMQESRELDLKVKTTTFLSISKKQRIVIKKARANLRSLHFLKRRQHHITTHVRKLLNLTKFNGFIRYLFLRLEHVIVQLGFAINLNFARRLIYGGYIFVNGIISYKPTLILKPNDRIQLILNYDTHNYFYKIHLQLRNRINLFYGRYQNISEIQTKKILQLSKTQFGKSFFTFTNYFPLSKFLEVDYEIFTGIVVYRPLTVRDCSVIYLIQYPFNYLALYNWKYYY